MYKVILVDDEICELECLKNSIDWQKFNLELIGCFNYANDALEFLLSNHTDIVITDISMPGKSGLDMIKTINERNDKVDFIIISAFSNFEYMRSAMLNNVFDYILKPIDFNEFENTLAKLSAKLESAHFISLDDISVLHCQQVINNWFADDTYSIDKVISVLNENRIFIDKNNSPVALINVKINDFIHYISDIWAYGIDKLHSGIINILSNSETYIVPIKCSYDTLDLLIISKDGKKTSFEEYITNLCKRKTDEIYNMINAETEINIYRVFDNIIDAQKHSSFILPFKPQPSSSTQTDAVSKAIEYINANYSNDISLTEISDYVSFSSYYFSRYFKNKTGETFSNYLNRIRMEKARNLLEATDMSIVSIAQAVGYNSKNHFYHMFKLYYNCTPNEYRNRKD